MSSEAPVVLLEYNINPFKTTNTPRQKKEMYPFHISS